MNLNGFQTDNIDEVFIKNNEFSYILQENLKYYRQFRSTFLFSEKMVVNKIEKTICNMHDKKDYVVRLKK